MRSNSLAQLPLSRRAFLRSSAFGVGALALAACAVPAAAPGDTAASGGDAAPADEVTTISFLTQGDATSELRYLPIQEMYADVDPSVEISFVWHPGGAIEIQQKLLTMIAGGEAPDVYWTHTYINPGLAKRNVPLALADLFASDTSWSPEDYFPASIADFTVNGNLYAMPRESTSTVMIYNKTLIEEAGGTLPAEGWTWDDFVDLARATTSGEGAGKIYGVANFNANANTFVRVWQKGGDVLNEDRTEFIMNNEAGVAAVQSIADLIREGLHVTGAELAGRPYAEVFLTGTIAMFPQHSVFTSILPAEFEFDIAPMPNNSDEALTTRVASAGHSIYSGTEKVEAAWSWLRMVESEQAFTHLAETGLSVPAHRAVAEGPAHLDPELPPASKHIVLEGLNYGRPEPVAGDWIGVHREITTALEGVYGVSATDPKTALDGIVDLVNDLIASEPTS